jgi:hypothetical protein
MLHQQADQSHDALAAVSKLSAVRKDLERNESTSDWRFRELKDRRNAPVAPTQDRFLAE